MKTLIYNVAPEDAKEEVKWLRSMKVYPSINENFIFVDDKYVARTQIGMIVAPDVELMIRLRHNIDKQIAYAKQ